MFVKYQVVSRSPLPTVSFTPLNPPFLRGETANLVPSPLQGEGTLREAAPRLQGGVKLTVKRLALLYPGNLKFL
jgi:hypothetical protein